MARRKRPHLVVEACREPAPKVTSETSKGTEGCPLRHIGIVREPSKSRPVTDICDLRVTSFVLETRDGWYGLGGGQLIPLLELASITAEPHDRREA